MACDQVQQGKEVLHPGMATTGSAKNAAAGGASWLDVWLGSGCRGALAMLGPRAAAAALLLSPFRACPWQRGSSVARNPTDTPPFPRLHLARPHRRTGAAYGSWATGQRRISWQVSDGGSWQLRLPAGLRAPAGRQASVSRACRPATSHQLYGCHL